MAGAGVWAGLDGFAHLPHKHRTRLHWMHNPTGAGARTTSRMAPEAPTAPRMAPEGRIDRASAGDRPGIGRVCAPNEQP